MPGLYDFWLCDSSAGCPVSLGLVWLGLVRWRTVQEFLNRDFWVATTILFFWNLICFKVVGTTKSPFLLFYLFCAFTVIGESVRYNFLLLFVEIWLMKFLKYCTTRAFWNTFWFTGFRFTISLLVIIIVRDRLGLFISAIFRRV